MIHQFTHGLDLHVRRVGERLGLTASQVVALRELPEPITARELAARMSCEPSNVTFVLDRLEQQGLLQRQPHPTDRRAKQIVLTATGRRRRREVMDQLDAHSPLQPLTPTQQQSLVDLLRTLTTGAAAPDPGGAPSGAVSRGSAREP